MPTNRSRWMTVPMMILAVCATVAGFLLITVFRDFICQTPSLAWQYVPQLHLAESAHEQGHDFVAVTSTLLALAGIGAAAFLYLGDRRQVGWLAAAIRPMYWLSHGKFFFDPIYDWLVVRPLAAFAALCDGFDRWVIDGLVNLVGAIPPRVGSLLRRCKTACCSFMRWRWFSVSWFSSAP